MSVCLGVERLRPAACVIYERGEAGQRRYWDPEYPESNNLDEGPWADQVREGMRTAVHSHLYGCEPRKLGAYLSGGTDSSSVVAFMNERHSQVNTFSIFFSEEAYSEANFARTTARHFNTSHAEKQLGPREAFEAIPKIAQHYDEPFANSSSFGAYHCAALAREAGIETFLAGDGDCETVPGDSR